MKKTNVLLTGVTGILGRHVFYELLRLYASGEKKGSLIVIIRPKFGLIGLERLKSIVNHRFRPAYLNQYLESELLSRVTLIEAGIEELGKNHLDTLEGSVQLYVIHAAAETDLSDTSTAHEKVYTHNYLATKHLLAWCTSKLYKFIFISTAFSIGHYGGVVSNEYISFDVNGEPVPVEALQHRNPYEKFKMKMEQELIQYCRQQGKVWQIIRPSSICGRMLEEPLYYTPEFNVFYLFGKFLFACALTGIVHPGDKIRIESNPIGRMNIVPVDYVAKTIVRAFENDTVGQLNAVSSNEVSLSYLLQCMSAFVGMKCELVAAAPPPEDMTMLETQYYQVVAPLISYYLATPLHRFDTDRLREIMTDVAEADVQKGFKNIYAFAYENEFKSL
jgi:nucleoside-diphosphate-sugar epimerase